MSTKKKTSQKTTRSTRKSTKKTSRKTTSEKKKSLNTKKLSLIFASGAECFWTTNGKVLANLFDLRDALAEMSGDVYRYHVDSGKNDFADWTELVLEDKELATALRRCRKPKTAGALVVKRLKAYKT